MKRWKYVLVGPETSIMDTIKIIDKSSLQIAIVVNENSKLIGTVTDGDIRRGILKNVSMDRTIDNVMNSQPQTVFNNYSTEQIELKMKNKNLKHLPVVDDEFRIVDLYTLKDFLFTKKKENPVILMAGGLGTRLDPLTRETPKPLLKVGSKPILEIILENFIENGFYNFYISVNYKSDMIIDYFGDGKKWDVNIKYIEEGKQLGTAGPLSLIKNKVNLPFIVMNGDLLTKVNFHQLLEFHNDHHSNATMCVREYNHQIPYGVIQSNHHQLTGIEEKPIERYFVNGGIYVLDPILLNYIPENSYYDMPSLFKTSINEHFETCIFPIREYWLDIGIMSDYEKANVEYINNFKD